MSAAGTKDERVDARERAILADLVARLETADTSPADAALVRRVLAAVDPRAASRRLRLVDDDAAKSPITDDERSTTEKQRRASRLRKIALGASVVAAAAALAAVVIHKPQPVASLTSAPETPIAVAPAGQLARSEIVLASGEVFVGDAAARVGSSPLAVGARVRTGHGRACLDIDPHIDVCLGGDTEVLLRSLAQERIEVSVLRGVAIAALEHRRPGQTFALIADDLSATAKGTVFAIQRDDAEVPRVVVLEGAVEVAGVGSATATVVAHTRWSPDASGAVPVGRSEEGRLLDLLSARPLWHPVDLGIVDIHGTLGSVRIDAEAPLPIPLQSFIPAGSHAIVLGTPDGEETSIDVDIIAGQTRDIDAASLLAAPRPSARVETGRCCQDLLDEARGQLETGHPAEALRVYRKIERDFATSAEATMVLVTVGKLEMRQGSAARALAAFDAYLRRGGPLAPEAQKGRIDALRALGRAVDERSAILRYLSKYPDGFDAAALQKRLATLSHP